MTPALTHVNLWIETLKLYAGALETHVAIVDAAAQKSRRAGRAAYRAALEMAETLKTDPPEVTPGAAFATFARLEETRAALDAGADAALAPALLEAATRLMSGTFAEGAAGGVQKLRAARAAAAAAARSEGDAAALAWVPAAAAEPAADVAREFSAAAQTSAGATLFAETLAAWSRAGVDVGRLAEDAKDEALGLEPDGAAAAARDFAARAGMHPLQAMGITFGLAPGGEASGRGAVDMTLPQATTAVTYDLAPLVDAKAAARFGRLANIFTGLNFRLVGRLRTITETPVAAGAAGAAPAAGYASGARTIDRGATFQALQGALPAESYAAAGAGPLPRVKRLGELLEEAVFAPAGATPTMIADPAGFRAKFETAEAEAPSLDEIGEHLARGFEAVYDAAPPETAEEFRALVVPPLTAAGEVSFRSYVARAVSEVAARGGEARLARADAARSQSLAALFGGASAAARGGRQETLLTSVIQLRDSISAASKSLLRAYGRAGTAARARDVFAAGPARGGAAHAAAQAARRRLAALALQRAVVAEALRPSPAGGSRAARAVEKLDTVEPQPSLKLFALNGDFTSSPEPLTDSSERMY